MDPVRQLFIEFNHPLRQPERNIRLPLIRRHHQRLCRRWTNKQLSNPQHGRKRRLALTSRHRPDSLSNPWRERTSNKLLLKATQLHRVSSTMPTRDTQIRMNETYTTGTTIAWPTLKTKRLNLDTRLRTSHITTHPSKRLTRKVMQILTAARGWGWWWWILTPLDSSFVDLLCYFFFRFFLGLDLV